MTIKAATCLRAGMRDVINQLQGQMFDDASEFGIIGERLAIPVSACALGAMVWGATRTRDSDAAVDALPCLLRPCPPCPAEVERSDGFASPCPAGRAVPPPSCGLSDSPWSGRLGNLIAHLNDDHRWTFEQIAAWLETLPDEEPPIYGGIRT